MSSASATSHPVLVETLCLAVPLWIRELLRLRGETRTVQAQQWARRAADSVASKGDILQYGSKKCGTVADVFNDLARGLAALALSPGGVLFAGTHWCVEHPGGYASDSITELDCQRSGYDPAPRPAVTIATTGML